MTIRDRIILLKAASLDAQGINSVFAGWVRDMSTGCYIWVSLEYSNLFNIPASRLLGRTPYDVFLPKYAEVYDAGDRRCMENRVMEQYIAPSQYGDDGETEIMVRKYPVILNGKVEAVKGLAFRTDYA